MDLSNTTLHAQGLGFRVEGLGFSGSRVQGLGGLGLGFRGSRVHGP